MAEIHKKITTCPNGHPYDPSRYESCPYCSSGSFIPSLDPFGGMPGHATNTEDGFSATTDPTSFSQNVPSDGHTAFGPTTFPAQHRLSNRMHDTMSVDPHTPAGAPSPVVGWLVAINGPCRGNDYRLRVGYNYIGRVSGDICIHGDATISAERDSSVTYVPQTKGFYIAHELGKNPLLLNGKPVIREAELKNYDRITIGSTNLIFIGLSGEHFDWSEG